MLSIQVDTKAIEAALNNAPGQLRFATQQAINKTAWDVRDGLKAKMPSVFNQGGFPVTPFTVNALRTYPAKTGNLTAEINFKKTPAGHYLLPEVFGGPRPMKMFEKQLGGFFVPNINKPGNPGAPADKYGNVSGPQILRMLSMLGKARTGQNQTAKKRKIRVLKGVKQFYFTKSGHIAESGSGSKAAKIWFYHRVSAPTYNPLFKFNEISKKIIDEKLPVNVRRAIALAFKRAGG